MRTKTIIPALALVALWVLGAFSPLQPAAARNGTDVNISSEGCTITVDFLAGTTTTYTFEVYDDGKLVSEQDYTVQINMQLPAPVSFSYTVGSPGDEVDGISVYVHRSDSTLASYDPYTDIEETCASGGSTGTSAACNVDLSGAVVGEFVTPADFYAEPGVLTSPVISLPAGKTAWVAGLDESGDYYKILWVCDWLWVQTDTMGPNYDGVWNGTPLPTDVVS